MMPLWLGLLPLLSIIGPWTYHSDFPHGLTGWMSFPLAQDIGFDPTIAVENVDGEYELIREGGGVIRPMRFIARSGTRVTLRYKVDFPASLPRFHMVLAGEDGHRYVSPLPATNGQHEVTVTGRQFGIST